MANKKDPVAGAKPPTRIEKAEAELREAIVRLMSEWRGQPGFDKVSATAWGGDGIHIWLNYRGKTYDIFKRKSISVRHAQRIFTLANTLVDMEKRGLAPQAQPRATGVEEELAELRGLIGRRKALRHSLLAFLRDNREYMSTHWADKLRRGYMGTDMSDQNLIKEVAYVQNKMAGRSAG